MILRVKYVGNCIININHACSPPPLIYPTVCKIAQRFPGIVRRGASAGALRSLPGQARRSHGPDARPGPGVPERVAPAL